MVKMEMMTRKVVVAAAMKTTAAMKMKTPTVMTTEVASLLPVQWRQVCPRTSHSPIVSLTFPLITKSCLQRPG